MSQNDWDQILLGKGHINSRHIQVLSVWAAMKIDSVGGVMDRSCCCLEIVTFTTKILQKSLQF